jgi:hypothetical protein
VQQNTSNICTLYSQAAKWKPRIDDEIRSIMTSLNADQQVEVMLPQTLKRPFRAMEKITFAAPEPETHVQANKLLDVVRGMIVCDSASSMLAVFQQILSSDTLQIVRFKNRLVQPTDGGWGDCLLNLVLKEDRIENHVFEVQIVPKSMLEVRTIGGHHDYAVFRCARELLEACGYDVTEDFYLTDLRKAIKLHESKQEYDRIPALQKKLAKLEPLLQQQAKLEADARRLVLADNFTTVLHRATTELAEVKGKIDQMKRKDHDDNDLQDIKDDSVGFQHPFLTLLDTKYDQAYDNDDFSTAQTLKVLRDSALPICMRLVKAMNAYSEAKAARQEASVLINLKDRKEQLESRLNELQQQLSRITLASSPTNTSGSSSAATTMSSEPSRGVVQRQVPVRVAEINVGTEEKKQDLIHRLLTTSLSWVSGAKLLRRVGGLRPHSPHATRRTVTAIDERQVLMELFHAAGGSCWTEKDNWGTDRPLGTWSGVEVVEGGKVTHLLLSSNELTGKRISNDLRALSH